MDARTSTPPGTGRAQGATPGKSATIPRGAPATTAQDYAALISLGFQYCQQLTDASWTDYNEHDPGVTILEQLCYALTDLGLRNTQPMAVLLANAPGAQPPPDTLVTGERILTSAPWTVDDYRRVLYDQVSYLKNAWLTVVRAKAQTGKDESGGVTAGDDGAGRIDSGCALGLYEVRVEAYEEDMHGDDDRTALVANTAALMRAQRNLGEDVARVVLLKPHSLYVYGTIEVGIQANPSDVLAEVLFNLQHFLVPSPKVRLPGALLQAGVPPDEVFCGPRLALGVIDTGDLADYKREIWLDDVIDIMLAVPGVRRVSGVTLKGEGLNADGDVLTLGDDEVPRLAPSIFEPPTGPYTIDVQLEGGIAQTVDAARVYRGIQARVAALTDEENYTALQTRSLDYSRVTQGQYLQLAEYTSIQHQFPMTYGIGREGVPALPNWRIEGGNARALPVTLDRRRRQALAQQLKGYLLLAEQLLANHLAQLANAWQLFALETGDAAKRSYFWQPLIHTPERETDPPDVFPLLSQKPGPDGTENVQHGVYVVDAQRRVVLVGRETGNLADAHAVRAEIVRRGVVTSAYAVERLERPEQGGQPEFRLIVAAADGTRLAVGEERYGTPERAHAAIDRIVTLLGRCAEDAALASRHLIVRALSGIMVRVADEGGRIVLDSGPLPTSAARAQRERELFEHGVERARYRLRRDERGWLRLTLHNADNEIIAWGEVRYTSIESARSGRNELIAWLRQLRGSAALREAHIERLPASDDATLGGYLSGLATLTARFDRAAERRNRFLDHLLARFGEAFANSLLPRFDPRADRGIGAQQALQHAKTVFLRNIVTLTAGRALAPDYAKPPAAPGAVAPVDGDNLAPADGFARRLALLLGINIPTDATGTLLPWQVRLTREAPPFLYVERDEPTDTAQPKANRRSFTLHSTQPGIVATLLAHGTSTQHYGERHDPAHDGADNWVLTFSWPGGPAQDIHRGTSREAVRAARDRLIHHLRTLASDPHALFSGEGFHVVEHVLLRPDQTTIDDDFYRQRVTLVFPDWPIRFQDPEFRAFVQRTVFDNTPAHLDVRCYWLGYGDMTLFERLHEAWRDGLQRSVLNEGSARPIEEAAALRKFIEQLDAREGAAH